MKKLSRKKKLLLNSYTSLINQFVVVICGMILPRFFIESFGSDVNGLVSSIGQFLSCISLMEFGMGAVVPSALYGPLAKKNNEEINRIIVSSERFFKKIALVFLLYVGLLVFIYPILVNNQFDFFYDVSLILIMAVSSFVQYYFGITYQLLLTADQKTYIPVSLNCITLILNTLFSVILMKNGCSVQVVKGLSAIVLMGRPLMQSIYVHKNYQIDKKVILNEEPIHQKWNGIIHHIAYFVLTNTDVIVLSIFSTLTNVSIYSIYNMVMMGLQQLITSLTSGITAFFGNLLANNEIKKLNYCFLQYDWIVHTLVTLLFSCAGCLIIPFVRIYTKGINDTNYIVPTFAILITLASATFCFRNEYFTIVKVVGQYKETQISALIEAALNLGISILFVFKYGLIGVAIGTLIAMGYRSIQLALYVNNIVDYKLIIFLKHVFIDILTASFIFLFSKFFALNEISFIGWFILALKEFSISIVIVFIMNLIFYHSMTMNIINSFKLKIKKVRG